MPIPTIDPTLIDLSMQSDRSDACVGSYHRVAAWSAHQPNEVFMSDLVAIAMVRNLAIPPTGPEKAPLGGIWHGIRDLAPGIVLCIGVALAATALERVEPAALGGTWLEALVLAILVGTAARTVWMPGARWFAGINFSAKTLLEIAMVLLGASVSTWAIVVAGPWLLVGIAGVVVLAIGVSYGIGRALGLPHIG